VSRVYNFSAGPAVLPEEVLKQAAAEMLDFNGTGMSINEMSHRSKAFDNVIETAEKDIRDLMGIPDNYKVLFLQGGASMQFSAVPLNLMQNKKAAYIVTGQWAKKAQQEASKYLDAQIVASSADQTFSYIPDCSDLDIQKMQIMYISVRTTQFMEQNIRLFQILRVTFLYLMFHHAFYQSLLMYLNTVLSMVVFRRV